jgi:hypothetical protein
MTPESDVSFQIRALSGIAAEMPEAARLEFINQSILWLELGGMKTADAQTIKQRVLGLLGVSNPLLLGESVLR